MRTQGEWSSWESPNGWVVRSIYRDDRGRKCTRFIAVINGDSEQAKSDAAFISEAPAMEAEIERLRAFVAAWDAWHSAKRESPELFAAVCAAREAVVPCS